MAAAILASIIEPARAIGLMLPLLMLMDAVSLKPYWGKWLTHESFCLCLGGLPGIALGVWFYTLADVNMLRFLIGSISLVFVFWQVLNSYGILADTIVKLPSWAGCMAGVVAGFTSFVSHAGGPPVAIYLLLGRQSKTEYQATTVYVFWIINIAKSIPYGFLGLFTWESLKIDLMLAPFAIAGVWLGVRGHHLIPEKAFFLLTNILLALTGLRLFWVALT